MEKKETTKSLSRRLYAGECTSILESTRVSDKYELNRLRQVCTLNVAAAPDDQIEKVCPNVWVLADQTRCGGTKGRFLANLLNQEPYKRYMEYVYVTEFPGGAQIALAQAALHLQKHATLFLPSGADKPNPTIARELGATIKIEADDPWKAAQLYVQGSQQRVLLPNGLAIQGMHEALVECASKLAKKHGTFDQVWCAVGSGHLLRALAETDLGKEYHGVAVTGGIPEHIQKLSRINEHVKVVQHPLKWTELVQPNQAPPFDSALYYDAKVWSAVVSAARSPVRILFWNVM